jgi:hypothetical protein
MKVMGTAYQRNRNPAEMESAIIARHNAPSRGRFHRPLKKRFNE